MYGDREKERERERAADLGSKRLPQWAPSLVQLRSRSCRSDTTMGIAFTRHFADFAGLRPLLPSAVLLHALAVGERLTTGGKGG